MQQNDQREIQNDYEQKQQYQLEQGNEGQKDLSRNLWLTIFSCLEKSDLMNCEIVCKKWKGFIKSKNHQLNNVVGSYFLFYAHWDLQGNLKLFWALKQFKFQTLAKMSFVFDRSRIRGGYSFNSKFYNINLINEELNIILKMGNLKFLYFTYFYHEDKPGPRDCNNLKIESTSQLEEIDYRFLINDKEEWRILNELLISSYQTLTCLYIGTDEGYTYFDLEEFQNLNKNQIEYLYFQYIDGKNPEVIQQMLEFKKLKNLHLMWKNDTPVQNIIQLIEGLGQNLEEIKLNWMNDEIIMSISNYCPNLKEIIIQQDDETFKSYFGDENSYNHIISDHSIYQLLSKCNKIRFLHLYCDFSMNCFPEQLENLTLICDNPKNEQLFVEKFKKESSNYDEFIEQS